MNNSLSVRRKRKPLLPTGPITCGFDEEGGNKAKTEKIADITFLTKNGMKFLCQHETFGLCPLKGSKNLHSPG